MTAKKKKDQGSTRDERRAIYRFLRLNRVLEERLTACYRQGQITGGFFRSLGQEATSVGSAMALGEGDILAPMIRNLGSILVRGVRPRDVVANYLAKGQGPTGGKDNVVHFGTVDGDGHFTIDERGGLVSCISPLGNLVSVLSGMVLAARLQGKNTVAMTYAGDGSISTGEFHEGMNFACAQRLPMVVVVENNGWAYTTPSRKQSLLDDLTERAKVYGCPGVSVDGQDVEAVLTVTREAVDRARAGEGPTFIEAKTYRMKGHAEHDDQRYVPKEELEEWSKRDPIVLYSKFLLDGKHATASELEEIDGEVKALVDDETEQAMAFGHPDTSTVLRGVYNDPETDTWASR